MGLPFRWSFVIPAAALWHPGTLKTFAFRWQVERMSFGQTQLGLRLQLLFQLLEARTMTERRLISIVNMGRHLEALARNALQHDARVPRCAGHKMSWPNDDTAPLLASDSWLLAPCSSAFQCHPGTCKTPTIKMSLLRVARSQAASKITTKEARGGGAKCLVLLS